MEFAPQQSNWQDIKVTLLLAGGHQYTLSLKPDAPLLHNFIKAIMAGDQKQGAAFSCLFQIKTNGADIT